MLIVRHGRLRSVISAVLATAMLASLIVMPASAAPTASTPTGLNAGTTGVTSIDGSGQAGMNGRYTAAVDIAAVKSTRTGDVDLSASLDTTLAAMGVATEYATLTVEAQMPNGSDYATASASFEASVATVGNVVAWMNALPAVDTSVTAAGGFLEVTHALPGAYSISVYDDGDGLASYLGLGAGAYTDVTGSYSASVEATFTPDNFGPAIDTVAQIGIKDAGVFVDSKCDTATGECTVIKVNDAFYLTASAGLKSGTVSFDSQNGVREAVLGSASVTQGTGDTDWQAGVDETLTVNYTSPGSDTDSVNGLRVTLPGQFVYGTTAIVTVNGGASDASVTVDPVAKTLTVDKVVFPTTADVAVEFVVKNSTTIADTEKLVTVESRNVGGSAWTKVNETTLYVVPNKIVGSQPHGINAGGYTDIEGTIKDIHGNVDSYWGHSLQVAISAPSGDATVTGSGFNADACQIDETVFTDGKFALELLTASASGVNTVTITPDNVSTPAKKYVVDTTAVGQPYKLEIISMDGKWSYADTETATLRVRLVDANGKRTSNIDQDRWYWVVTEGSWSSYWIPKGYSDSGDITIGGYDSPRDAIVTANDPIGWVFPADMKTIHFLDSGVVAGNVDHIEIAATKKVNRFDDWDANFEHFNHYGQSSQFGYAYANGTDKVEFTGQLVDAVGNPVKLASQVVTLNIGADHQDYDWPGKLNAKTAVTDVNGQFKFSMTSTAGSFHNHSALYDEVNDEWASGYDYGWGWDVDCTYFTPVTCETTADASGPDNTRDGYGFAYFTAPELDYVDFATEVGFANGTDSLVADAYYVYSGIGEPAAGVDVQFVKSGVGSLAPQFVTTDAEGKASTAIKSDELGEGYLYVLDENGGSYGSWWYEFVKYKTVVTPVKSTYQAGESAMAQARITLVDAEGAPVYFDTDYYSPYFHWSTDDGDVDNWDVEMATIGGKQVGTGFLVDIYPYFDTTGTVEFYDISIHAYTAGNELSRQYISCDDMVEGETTLTFVNNAHATATANRNENSNNEGTITGFGFNPSNGPLSHRYADVYIKVNGNWVRNNSARAYIDYQGNLTDDSYWYPDFYGYIDNWGYQYFELTAGSYDLMIDGQVFDKALTVTDSVAHDFTPVVTGLTDGQVFAPGSSTVLIIGGPAGMKLGGAECWVNEAYLGDNSDASYSTIFPLDMSKYPVGKYTLKVGAWAYDDELYGETTLTFYIKATPALSAKASSSAPGYNAPFNITGNIASSGNVAGLPVVLSKSSDNVNWTTAGTVNAGADGGYSFATSASSTTYYKVATAGNDGVNASAVTITVKPKASLAKPVVRLSQTAGKAFGFYGMLKPAHTAGAKSVYVYVYKWNGSKFVYVKKIAATNSNLNGYTKYSAKTSLAAGKYRLRALHGDASHSATWSAFTSTVTVK